ncbi:MAG: glycosyltransferase family 4 protein [Chitinophagales bacterium]
MRVAIIARSTLFTSLGGDTVQVRETAKQLRDLGIAVDIKLANARITYANYDLLHFFNITRPADILSHISQSKVPFVLTPNFVDFSEYDKYHRKGIAHILFRYLSRDHIEYLKTFARWILGRDKLVSKTYLLKGQRRSIREILSKASMVLPNSEMEFQHLQTCYGLKLTHRIIPNGVNAKLFRQSPGAQKNPALILCAARIEGIKNQKNLIRALNNAPYKVLLIGAPGSNQKAYYRQCRALASDNIQFMNHMSQEDLLHYYQQAKVHILPSWFETCGLSSLEAAAAGCNLVVSDRGYSKEYLQNSAFYCDPSSPRSIREAIERAMHAENKGWSQQRIDHLYSWEEAGQRTISAYREVLSQTRKIRIGILGTRGIPNYYGGFEQFAEHLSTGLLEFGHDVIVYNTHDHPYQQKSWKNVQIEHRHNPERFLGSFGQFIYDFNCIRDARKKNLDLILMLGYTSSSIWNGLLPADLKVIYNMDGLEWMRTKYSRPVQQFLLYAEKLAVKFGNHHVADSPVIQSYLKMKYGIPCEHIGYGAEVYDNEDEQLLEEYEVNKYEYLLLIARFEPENNIETILEGFSETMSAKKFLVVGDTRNKYGKHLINRFGNNDRIQFIGPLYNNIQKIHTLRTYSYLYFHGHMVGGTNPSLLEAMASRALIAAHQNLFNQAILQEDAYYFSNAAEVRMLIENTSRDQLALQKIKNNLNKIREIYTWKRVVTQYESLICKLLQIKKEIPAQSQIEKVVA